MSQPYWPVFSPWRVQCFNKTFANVNIFRHAQNVFEVWGMYVVREKEVKIYYRWAKGLNHRGVWLLNTVVSHDVNYLINLMSDAWVHPTITLGLLDWGVQWWSREMDVLTLKWKGILWWGIFNLNINIFHGISRRVCVRATDSQRVLFVKSFNLVLWLIIVKASNDCIMHSIYNKKRNGQFSGMVHL